VTVTNDSEEDITLHPGGFGAKLVAGNEQSEPSSGNKTGGEFLSGVSEEFQILFLLKRTSMDEIDSFRYKFDDYKVGAFDFIINLNGEVLPTPVPTPTAVPTVTAAPGSGYTRMDPASIGVDLFDQADGLFNYREARVGLLEIVRGEEARKLIGEASEFNSYLGKLDPGFEYALARIRFDYQKGADHDAVYNLSSSKFVSVSSDGTEYKRAVVIGLEPDLDANLYPGASHEGWAAFQVAQSDPAPLLNFGRDSSGRGGLWWKFYE